MLVGRRALFTLALIALLTSILFAAPVEAQAVKTLVKGFKPPAGFLEGPVWDKQTKALYFCDYGADAIRRVGGGGERGGEIWFTYPDLGPNGMILGSDGNFYVCDPKLRIVLRVTPEKELRTIVDSYRGEHFNGPNDCAFDSKDNLYFSDPNRRKGQVGGIYRWSADEKLTRIDTDLKFPNGIIVSPDDSRLYVAESGTNRVLRYALNPNGTFGPREVFHQFRNPKGKGEPDGMAWDEKGNLYVAHWGSWSVRVLNPEGKQIRKIDVPGEHVTNVCFGGPDGKTLYITEVETGGVYTWRQ
jgi:gluconolactonase